MQNIEITNNLVIFIYVMTKKEFQQELKSSANIAVQRANKFLEQLDLSLHINWEYEDWDYNDLNNAIGVYEHDSVFEGDISIGFNINNLYKWFVNEIKENPWSDQYTILDEAIQTNVFHEMGHGIVQLINDYLQETDDLDNLYDNNQELFDNVLDNEEDSVEELAWAMYDNQLNNSKLYKLIQLYIGLFNNQNSLNEHDNHYTQYSDIEKELVEYAPYFENKVIMLCCDKPYISEFWNFFQTNLKNLSIPMVVSTFWSNEQKFPAKMTILTGNGVSEKPLKGNGDFLSDEIKNIMSYVDVVVTNPPFSNGMFSSFLQQLKQLGKKFIVIGPTQSAYNGKVFNMFKNGEVSMGHNYDMKFSDQLDGGKLRRKQTSWFTNLDTPEKGDFPQNNRNIGDYQKYDNIDAINVDFIKDIPTNYNGMIGVPPSVINKIDLNLYDLIDSKENLTINGKRVPKRYIIQRKNSQRNVAESLSERIFKNFKSMLY